MAKISFWLEKEDEKLIREYVAMNELSLSDFIRDAILEKIEERLNLDEAKLLDALERSKKGKSFDHTEVWDILD